MKNDENEEKTKIDVRELRLMALGEARMLGDRGDRWLVRVPNGWVLNQYVIDSNGIIYTDFTSVFIPEFLAEKI